MSETARKTRAGQGGLRQGRQAAEPAAKRAVFDAAVRLFARNGYAATGMRALAREAGVNLAAVNYFYGSKKGLLKAILEDYFAGLGAVLEANLSGAGTTDARLRRTTEAAARYMARERDKMLIGLSELPHDDAEITGFKAEMVMRLIGLIRTHLIERLTPEERARIPIALVMPALAALVASHFLFRPVLEKARPPGFDPAVIERYPELIARLFMDGFNGLLADEEAGAGQ